MREDNDGRTAPDDCRGQCRRRGRPRTARGRDRHGFRHFGRPYRADFRRPREAEECGAHRAGARGVARRRDGRGLRPAARRTRRPDRPGAVGARQWFAWHARGTPVVLADAAAHRLLRSAEPRVARALSIRHRRLRRLGCAARVLGRHQAGVPGAGAEPGGAGDAVRDQARNVRPERPGRGAVLVRFAQRQGRTRHQPDTLSNIALPAAATGSRRHHAGRTRSSSTAQGAAAGDHRRQRRAHCASLQGTATAL